MTSDSLIEGTSVIEGTSGGAVGPDDAQQVLAAVVVGARGVDEVSPGEASVLLVRLASLQAALAMRLRAAGHSNGHGPAAEPDRLLTAEEVAARFGRSVAWVYRQARHWPFTRRLTRRTVRFSAAGLEKFLSQRRTFPGEK